MESFIVDCPYCRAKVAAELSGHAYRDGHNEDFVPFAEKLLVGKCPICKSLIAGETHQVTFEEFNGYENEWSDVARIYPEPSRRFMSFRIPKVVKDSIHDAEKSLQAGAYIAACAMSGRALEAVCRHILNIPGETPKKIMLGDGIEKLKERKIIDDRLYDWSQQLHETRNKAAHPDDATISRQDAEDLLAFTYAIIEYIYDLTDRYDEFKARLVENEGKKRDWQNERQL